VAAAGADVPRSDGFVALAGAAVGAAGAAGKLTGGDGTAAGALTVEAPVSGARSGARARPLRATTVTQLQQECRPLRGTMDTMDVRRGRTGRR
jgi:hypothetical protein